MPEEKVEQLRPIEETPISDLDKPVEGDMNPLAPPLPAFDEKQIRKGIGGKYLNQVLKTDNFSTTSTTFVDVTDLTITKDVNGRRVLLMLVSTLYNNTSNETNYLAFNIGGTDTDPLIEAVLDNTNNNMFVPLAMFYVTSRLEGSQTFKVRMKVTGGTGYLWTHSVFIAIELSE